MKSDPECWTNVITYKRAGYAGFAGFVVLLAAALAAPAIAKKQPVDIGPEPEWYQAQAIAEATIREQLLDPYSAMFRWRNDGLVRGKKAWLVCGMVNSKNAYGGYAGFSMFVVSIVNGKAVKFKTAPQGLGYDECAPNKPPKENEAVWL